TSNHSHGLSVCSRRARRRRAQPAACRRELSGMSSKPSARSAPAVRHEPIAIVGMACRFPGADSPDRFWYLLADGRDIIREIPADRFDVDALFAVQPATPGRIMSRWGGFVDDIDRFDA